MKAAQLERPRGAPLRVRHMAILRRSLQLLALERSAALGPVRALSDLPVAQRYQHMRKDPALFDPGLVKQLLHPEFTELLHALDEGADVRSLVAQVGSTEAGEAAHTCAHTRVHAMYARSAVHVLPLFWCHGRCSDVYSFPLLNDEACDRLCDEIEHFGRSGLPARRPNSMNRYGLILNDIGMRPSLDALQAEVWRVARELWPVEGARFDDHHSFCVSYKPKEDRGLDMHTDNSDVTLNVCLGRDFTASGLTFCGEVGQAGQLAAPAMHGAVPRLPCLPCLPCPPCVCLRCHVELSWRTRGRPQAGQPAVQAPARPSTHAPRPAAARRGRHQRGPPRQPDHVELQHRVPRR